MYRKTVLPNGVRIVTQGFTSRTVSVGIWVDAGSRDEDQGINGSAHFVEHMLFKGTTTRSAAQIGMEFDVLGGMSNGFTTQEITCYYATVLKDKVEALVDLLSDIFLNSAFSSDEVLRERDVILQEISMVDDSPDEQIHDIFPGILWGEHPLGNTILGSRKVIGAMTREKLCSFIEQFYSPEKILVAAAGPIEHVDFVALVEKSFSRVDRDHGSSERRVPSFIPAGRQVIPKQLEQEHLILGAEAPPATSPDRYKLLLLNTVLGGNMSSRLFQEIREKQGLAYAVYSYVASYIDTGYMGIYLGVDPGSANRALALVAQETKRILQEPVSSQELENAKDYAKANLLLSADSMETRMMQLARNELLFERSFSLEEIIASLESVSAGDLTEVAQHIFGGRELSLAAVGPLPEEEIEGVKFS
ncbi:M16 family metallopeptidase [Thermodesulfobacteriota bacterium]